MAIILGNADDNELFALAPGDELRGLEGNDILNGSTGNEILKGGLGDDSLYGFGGDDTLDGGSGDNYVDGGEGNDRLNINNNATGEYIGGNGNDYYYVIGSGSIILNEQSYTGYDTLFTDMDVLASGVGAFTFKGIIEEIILAAPGAGQNFIRGPIIATGNSGDNRIIGNRQNNFLYGLNGDDTMFGSFGNDTLEGGDGADDLRGENDNDFLDGGLKQDTLTGGKGDDILAGGRGIDSLTGGEGIDTFAFGGAGISANSGAATFMGQDIITDFDPAQEIIQLSISSFTALGTGGLTVGNNLSGANGSSIPGFAVYTTGNINTVNALIVYNSNTGGLLYNANGTTGGTGGGGYFATLSGAPTSLTASNFTIVA
jgi:serralysin